jgi:hypothetical protein
MHPYPSVEKGETFGKRFAIVLGKIPEIMKNLCIRCWGGENREIFTTKTRVRRTETPNKTVAY